MDKKILIKKAKRVLNEEGMGMLFRKTRLYLKNSMSGKKIYSDSELAQKCFMDVLFINGCYLEHPARYRVSHQREQLEAGGISAAEVFYQDLSLDYVNHFRMFIFFRCPYTELVGEFIQKARSYNKKVLFDIDDLMIDTQYTETIPYVRTMAEQERKIYDDGVRATGKLLRLCDGAITTTEALAGELRKYVPDVVINRNTASEQLVKLSEEARTQCQKAKNERQSVKIGYFSGSITHDPDLEMVTPALERILEKVPQAELLLVGEVTVPEALRTYADRITVQKAMDWKKLPTLIASVDINLAPLEDTLFNRAKSENKWMEAALVKTVTVASNVGAFARMIQQNETGVLCENTEEDWFQKLYGLVADKEKRNRIAEKAYRYVNASCTTLRTAASFANCIYEKMTRNVVFILPVIQISGGALVTLKHAAILQEAGYDVTIFHDGYEKDREISQGDRKFPVIAKREVEVRAFLDRCVATLWSTCDFFYEYGKIGSRYYLVQNFETGFYKAGESLRINANRTYCMRMPVKYITISKWCQGWLNEEYSVAAQYAPNGLESERFYPAERSESGRIRILVEGNSDDDYKNVDESFRIVNQLNSQKFEIWYMSYQGKPKDWYRVDRFLHKVPYAEVPDIYRQCHILIKSSILESFSYPPLEMMATGGCVVVAPNGGNVEYLRDGENCLFYRQGDEADAIEKIMELVANKDMREKLIRGGISTGKARDWNQIKTDVLSLYLD